MNIQLAGEVNNGKEIDRYRWGSLKKLMGMSKKHQCHSSAGMFAKIFTYCLDPYTASDA